MGRKRKKMDDIQRWVWEYMIDSGVLDPLSDWACICDEMVLLCLMDDQFWDT